MYVNGWHLNTYLREKIYSGNLCFRGGQCIHPVGTDSEQSGQQTWSCYSLCRCCKLLQEDWHEW